MLYPNLNSKAALAPRIVSEFETVSYMVSIYSPAIHPGSPKTGLRLHHNRLQGILAKANKNCSGSDKAWARYNNSHFVKACYREKDVKQGQDGTKEES